MVLLIALLIIGAVYSGIFQKEKSVAQQMVSSSQKTENMLSESNFQHIATAINSFFTDNGRFPESLTELVPVYLRTEKEILDPWGTPYRIDIQDEIVVTVTSAGNDKVFNTTDDAKRRLK